jgi:hypothetical protein
VLLQTIHDITANAVAFFFRQFFTKSTHKFAGPLSANAMAKLSKSPRVRIGE